MVLELHLVLQEVQYFILVEVVVQEILFVDHQLLEEQEAHVELVVLVVEALEVHVEQQELPIEVVEVELLNLADLLMQADLVLLL